MTTPSGQISAQDIKNEFGETGEGKVALGSYRVAETRGALTLAIGDGVPSSGAISFDNLRNKVLNYGEENIEKKSICLIEGIPAGHFQSANTSNSLKIFIDCNKEIRKKRFVNKYIQDGRSIDEIQHLWEKRIENEDSYVYDQIDSSDYTFNSDIISGEEI